MCSAKKYLVFHAPLSLSRNEGLLTDFAEPGSILRVPKPRLPMQSQSDRIRQNGDREDPTAWLLSQHELDQEYLYRLWKAGRITHAYVQTWAKALSELEAEASCDYFVWLMQQNPSLQLCGGR